MHGLELITRINSETPRAEHPLRMHPRIYALRQSVRGMAVQSRAQVAPLRGVVQVRRPVCRASPLQAGGRLGRSGGVAAGDARRLDGRINPALRRR